MSNVGRTRRRRYKNSYVLVQFRMKPEARLRLRMLCAQLGITAQEFIKRLLKGALADVELEKKDRGDAP